MVSYGPELTPHDWKPHRIAGLRRTASGTGYRLGVFDILLSVMGPVILIVTIGAVVGPRLGLEVRTLSKLAYWILGPAFMFDSLADADLPAETVVNLSLASIAAFGAAGVVGAAISKALGNGFENVSADVVSSTYGNVGNTGIAICVFALGEQVRAEASVVMVVVNTLGVLAAVSLASFRTGSMGRALLTALTTPLALGALAALPVNALDVAIPQWLDRPVALVAGALIPVMLLTLGLQLREVDVRRPEQGVIASAPAKLVVAPVVGWFAAAALGLAGTDQGVVLLQASMPPAVFTMLVAVEHNFVPRRITSSLVTLTAFALFTVPVAVAVARG